MVVASLHDQIQKLSPRQMQIAALLIEGKSGKEIATILSISLQSVKQHVRKMCWKTGVENRTQFIVMFVKWQMLVERDTTTL